MKRYFLAGILVLLWASCGLSTETRVSTTGDEGWLMVDDSNIFQFPARVLSFPNLVVAELGSYPADALSDGSIGILLSNSEELTWGVLGVFANRPYPQLDLFEVPKSLASDVLVPHPALDLLYGRKVGKGGLGLHAEWAGDLERSSGHLMVWDRYSYLLGLGGGVQIGLEGESVVDISLRGRRYGFSVERDDTLHDRGRYSYGGTGRAFYRIGDFSALIPYLKIEREDLSFALTRAGAATGHTWRETSIEGGIGMNLTPYQEFTLILGLLGGETISEFDSSTSDMVYSEYTDTYLTAPALVVGVESEIRDWLTWRMGGRKALVRHEHRVAEFELTEISTSWSAPFSLSLGLGLRFGEFRLDMELGSDFPFTLGYLMSGEEGGVFTQASATYSFEIF